MVVPFMDIYHSSKPVRGSTKQLIKTANSAQTRSLLLEKIVLYQQI